MSTQLFAALHNTAFLYKLRQKLMYIHCSCCITPHSSHRLTLYNELQQEDVLNINAASRLNEPY